MTEVINSISDFEKYLKNTKKVVEEALDFSLGPENPEILRESMRYSLLAGGKRIRPILCLASCANPILTCDFASSKCRHCESELIQNVQAPQSLVSVNSGD